jgi:hypothetical protein
MPYDSERESGRVWMWLDWPFTCGNPSWRSLDGGRRPCAVATRIAPGRARDQLVFDSSNI